MVEPAPGLIEPAAYIGGELDVLALYLGELVAGVGQEVADGLSELLV